MFTHCHAEFMFYSPKLSNKTALLVSSSAIGSTVISYTLLTTLLKKLEVTDLPVKLLTQLRLPLTNWLTISATHQTNMTFNEKCIAVATIALSVLTGVLLGWLTYSYQPEGKLVAARKRLYNLLMHDQIPTLLNNNNNLLENINMAYIESTYPLVTAQQECILQYSELKKAATWLKEAIFATDDRELKSMAHNYLTLIKEYINTLSCCIHTIKSDPNWLKQLKCYELQKSREAQEQLVTAINMSKLQDQHVYVHHT